MKNSLKKTKEFKEVYDNKQSLADENIVMYIKKNEMESNRLGISVSKKVGNSVIRHLLTRRAREIFRLTNRYVTKGIDMVIVFRKGADEVSFESLKNSFLKLYKKHKVLNEENIHILN
jgi:ribonuclease P protein component